MSIPFGWLKNKRNEIFAPKSIASAIDFDNTLSGLNSSSVQGAIDELINGGAAGGTSASNITYDNSSTDMIATTVQDAILELYQELQLRALKAFEVIYMVDVGQGYKEEVQLGSTALLPTSFTPQKDGYVFIGWRRDTVASNDILTECTVGEEPLTLYAVFRKQYTLTFTSYQKTESLVAYEYYNNENIVAASVTAPTGIAYTGFTWRGWSNANIADGNAAVLCANRAVINNIKSNGTYYGLYQQTITVTYNGNGSTGGSTASHTGTRYYSASGNYVNPSFTLKANGFTKTNYAFVKWAAGSTSGTQYAAGASVTLTANTTYYAIWNQVILDVMATIGGGWSGATSANQSQVYVNIGGGSDCVQVNKTIRSSNFNIDSKYKYITISGSTSGYRLNHARLYYSNGSKYKDISVTGKTNISGITGNCYISISVGNPAVGNGAYWGEAHYYVTGVKLSVS